MVASVLQIVGVALVVLAVALWSPVLAVMLAGLGLLTFGLAMERS